MIRKYKITDIIELGPDTRIFRFEPVEGKIPDYRVGQFAFLHILDEKGESIVKRPYSIASAPHMPYIELCIKLVKGELTGRLESMERGAILGMEEPTGPIRFNDEEKAGLIAGGTGISLAISILRHIAHKKLKGEFCLFYSVRKKENILYRNELEELQKNPQIKVVITLTREEDEWEGEKGRLCHTVIEKYVSAPKEFSWWICGPMGMLKAMRECLSSCGVDPKKIHMEGWG